MTNYTWEHYSAAQTAVVKSDGGFLHSVVINTTAAGAITLYDNASAASGKVIAVIKASILEKTLLYDIPFVSGLTIKLAAASDITVVFT